MGHERSRYQPVDTKKSISAQEEEILAFWKTEKIFEKSIEPTSASGQQKPLFSFYDGPPFATGLPHYGHLLAGTIKDVIPRYKTMKGFCVPRRFGWDCHGLPVENEIEKAEGLSGAHSIEQFGVAKFNEACRKIVLRYSEEWKGIVERFGRWVDFSKTYKTMDPSFMESVWWVFSQLYQKGLIYKGYKVMPFSTKLGTPLSNFEATENYKEVQDPSIAVAVQLCDIPKRSLVIWTTTPWTLVSNCAIACNPDAAYLVVKSLDSGNEYIVAESRVSFVFKDAAKYEVVETLQGHELAGTPYVPLFPYFESKRGEGAFRVLAEPFVQLDDGTGLVHLAPGFGEDDFYACQRAKIPVVCPVDQNGSYTDEILDFKGRYVKDCDKEIIQRLKKEGKILLHETLVHRYPFCWRSDTPLIYKAVSTWFVAVENIKDRLVAANEKINWVPGHIKYGRFGKWLENARDWAISRNRYWGTPIPIWEAADGERIVIGSIEELKALSGVSAEDLHRHYIDEIEIVRDGKRFRRISEVFDCWFESGSMPYAQNHYPFENRELFQSIFPADFIAEGLDQTRGWFYTLTVLSAALFDAEPFKNVIVNGIILAEDGAKMSKRLRNYPDPMDILHKYGADAIRLYMLSSPAVRADDLCFSESGVELVLRQVLLPLLNAYSFYVTYADLYKFDIDDPSQAIDLCSNMPQDELDRWILSKTGSFIARVEAAFEKYDLQAAALQFSPFIDMVTNWYIRRSRRRFWNDADSQDRREAFSVLHAVLKAICLTAAPCIPFFSEMMWKNLRSANDPISVHLAPFPDAKKFRYDEERELSHEIAQKVAKIGHALRKELQLKVRQPLESMYVISADQHLHQALLRVEKLLLDELNVKKLVIESDERQFVDTTMKPNFRILGKKVGKKMRAAQEAIAQLSFDQIEAFLAGGEGAALSICVEGEPLLLEREDVLIERVVKDGVVAAHEEGLTVAFNTALSEALLAEGLAREVINKLNTMRRDLDLNVSDRIVVLMKMPASFQAMLAPWLPYIQEEALAISIDFNIPKLDDTAQEWQMNGEPVYIGISKVDLY